MASPRDLFFQMLQKGVEEGSAGARTGMQQQGELERMLQGKEAEKNNKKAAYDRSLETIGKMAGIDPKDPKFLQKAGDWATANGNSLKVGEDGFTFGTDPTAKNAAKAQTGLEGALKHVHDVYGKGSKAVQDKANAAAEGLDLVNDPKQIGSLGQARTLAIKAFGMNRYNTEEGKAILPPSIQGTIAGLFNTAGGEEAPLNDSQRRSLNSIFQASLAHAKNDHDALKQNAMNTYRTSTYFDPARHDAVQSVLGKPIDDKLQAYQEKYKALPTTSTPPEQRPAPTGVVDKARDGLMSLFGMGAKPSAPSPAPAQPAAPVSAPVQAPGLTPPALPGAAPKKVRVRKGTETLEIDPADLPHAAADGYSPIGQ